MHRLASFASAILAVATLATAATAAEPRQQFIDMGVTNITGEVKAPSVAFVNQRKRAIFERMMRLKKEMLPAIGKTLGDPTFK